MGSKHDTLFRTLAMLKIIPKEPRYKTTSIIHAALEENGFKVSLRTIQRDLDAITAHLPLICIEGDGENRWNLPSTYSDQIIGLGSPKVLAFVLVQEYLSRLLSIILIGQDLQKSEAPRLFKMTCLVTDKASFVK